MSAVRQSTDVVAVEDRDIATALHFIREHACHGLTVDEVVRHNPVSRSTLERQLRKYHGRTPQQEIRYVQVTRVRELLLSTDLSAERIAVLCGFEHPEYLHLVFKRVTGMTPGEFQRKAKPSIARRTLTIYRRVSTGLLMVTRVLRGSIQAAFSALCMQKKLP